MGLVLYELCGADERRLFSPHCWKARMALAHKGLSFESRPVPFSRIKEIGGGFSPTVPVLDDNGRLVRDSWDIAIYLEDAYPGSPTLFGGDGGKATAKFVESWALMNIHLPIFPLIVKDIHDVLDPADKAYFRESREKRIGSTLEAAHGSRDARLEFFRQSLGALRHLLKTQPWIGGQGPLFADYLVFGPLQWARVVSNYSLFEAGDRVQEWFERCLDLYSGLGRATPAAA